MLKGFMDRGNVLVSCYCVTNHPKTQKSQSISTDIAHRSMGHLGLLKCLLLAVGGVGGSPDLDWTL